VPASCSILAGLERSKRLTRIEASGRALASKKRVCIVAFALIPVVLRLALLPWIPPPQPGIQDEFSYLLAGDTFASARLTNTPHPLWVFFESVHILQQPTYMSKYPPLIGLVLALGQRAFGNPWIGILLSTGALCGTLAWAMQNWLPPLWAFIGTALAVLKIGILSYWSESYWGGAGAAIGGALLIGSLPSLIRRSSFRSGIPAAIGIALLANSRPFEGLLLALLCLGYAAWRIIRGSSTPVAWFHSLWRGIVAPLAMVMVPVGAWMAFYNFRVTGDALLMPYVAHERQYAVASVFFWQKPKTVPAYRHEALRRAWTDWDLNRKLFQREHFLLTRPIFYASLEQFYLGIPLLVLIVTCAPAIVRSRRTRAAFWLAVLFLAGLGLELEFIPHYAAPATVLLYIVASGALRSLRHWRPRGARIAYPLYGLAIILVVAPLVADLFRPEHRFLYDKRDFQAERARILKFLDRAPGKQLVFLRYGPNHDINREWVYNRADIDSSAIVWARSMGPDKDRALISYYTDRRVWLLEDNGFAQISAYASAAHAGSP
jgi:hypothetical protein